MEQIYVSTDKSEIIDILKLKHHPSKSGIETGDFKEEIIKKNGFTFSIADLSITYGENIQKNNKLEFNPMSVIQGDFNKRLTNNLIKKLVGQGLWIAIPNNGETKHFFPTKYEGYQGGGFYNDN